MSSTSSNLAARRDGVFLPEAEARALWTEFSAHMDAHRGDEAGFARSKGCAVARAEFEGGRAVLSLYTTSEAAAKAAPKPNPKAAAAKKLRKPNRNAN